MGALIASGEAVPLSAIEGVTAQQAEALAEHGINDIDSLAHTSVDDLVEFLDISLDEAEVILNAALAVIAMRERSLHGETQQAEHDESIASEEVEQHAVSAQFDESVHSEVEPSDAMTEIGYDEAVERGIPFSAEPEILARDSVDPVPLTESEPFQEEELPLLEPGRDLRPDTVTPAPDITSTGAAAVEHVDEFVVEEKLEVELEAVPSVQTTSASDSSDVAASVGGTNEEKQDASPDAAE
jgi:hypothetical protein